MIQATRKTGFLVEDGQLMGTVIGYLRFFTDQPDAKRLADQLDAMRVGIYYEPVQPKLITEQIEEVQP